MFLIWIALAYLNKTDSPSLGFILSLLGRQLAVQHSSGAFLPADFVLVRQTGTGLLVTKSCQQPTGPTPLSVLSTRAQEWWQWVSPRSRWEVTPWGTGSGWARRCHARFVQQLPAGPAVLAVTKPCNSKGAMHCHAQRVTQEPSSWHGNPQDIP